LTYYTKSAILAHKIASLPVFTDKTEFLFKIFVVFHKKVKNASFAFVKLFFMVV